MHWLRIWIPSWRLFDQEGHVPRLFVRLQDHQEWLPVLKPPILRWYHIFLNPDGGYHHAACSAVEAFLQNPKNVDAYRIVCRICRRFLNEMPTSVPSFQFKISVNEEDVLLSGQETR